MRSEGNKLELDVEHGVPSAHYRPIFDTLARVQIGLLDTHVFYNSIEFGHLQQHKAITLIYYGYMYMMYVCRSFLQHVCIFQDSSVQV